MPEQRDAILSHFNTLRVALIAAIEGLTPPQLTEQPEGEWSIKDQLLHIAAWDRIRADEVTRISAGHTSTWRMSGEQDAALNELFHELHRDLTIEQAMWELRSSRDRLLDAIVDATERGLDTTLYGEAGLMTQHEALHASWIREWRAKMNY